MYVIPAILIMFGIVFLANASATTLIILSIVWFGFGIIGTGIVHYMTYKKITWKDSLSIILLGAFLGVLAFGGAVQDFRKLNCKTI